MPLPTPILDDRSWQQLRDELVRRIPVYTPEWTDHNPSDPGITLLELFAFLGENLLFRFNQIPENTRLEFLRLLRVPLRPARPARGMLALRTRDPRGELVEIGSEALAGETPFETQEEVVVWPVEIRALAKRLAPAPQTDEARLFAQAAIDASELRADEEEAYYVPEPLGENPSEPNFQPVDFGATVDGILWLAVLRTRDTDPARLGDAVINVGFVPDREVPTMDEVEPCPGIPDDRPGDEVVWEFSTGENRGGEPIYRALVLAGDTTRGLARQGTVRIRLPRAAEAAGVPVPPVPELAGAGSFPPEIEDEELAERVLFWIRAYRRRADRRLGRVTWVGANATQVLQHRTARTEFVGTGTGGAAQEHPLVHRQVVRGSLELQVEETDGWRTWTEVDDLAASFRGDRVYVLDAESGLVRFGDGTRGRPPQIGERIRALRYRYGGGAAGNVPAGAIDRIGGAAAVKCANPLPTVGGGDAEEIADALERIPGELRRRDRAVTASDFRELSLAVPGVGRAEVLPRFHPPTRRTEAAGIVTVVVWPRHDSRRPNAPMPDRDLIDAVCHWLDLRRLVTTELYVVPPSYRRISVAVGLKVKPGYGVEAVRRWVELVIRQYLAPLPPFGPSGAGWPMGRWVRAAELEAAALQVEGVEYLEGEGIRVARERTTADGGTEWVGGTVRLEPYEVVELVEITVVEGEPLAPGEPLGPPAAKTPEGRDAVPVPIPVLREEC